MKALLVGIIFIAAAILAALPAGLDWWPDIIVFLKGMVPVLAVFIGLIACFIGVSDMRDKAQAKKEEAEEAAAEAKTEA
jgi:uncharacterized membrane protein (DUF441 family)